MFTLGDWYRVSILRGRHSQGSPFPGLGLGLGLGYIEPGLQMIRAKYDSRKLTRQFAQDDSRNRGL